MIYTDLTQKAMVLCYEAHKGQYDKSGVPYVFHPFHVAEQLEDEYDICVALMHDIVEDTQYTIEDIAAEGFPKEIVEAVSVLTKKDKEDYQEYIKRVSTNDRSVRIKLKDLEHNSDLSRLPGTTDEDMKRLDKYKKAKEYLLSLKNS